MDFSPAFRNHLARIAGEDGLPVVLDALSAEASVSVRINPAKAADSPAMFGNLAESAVPWNENAFYLSERPSFTLDPLLHAGAYYVQDSSAMFPGYVFRKVLENNLLETESGCLTSAPLQAERRRMSPPA